MLKLGNRQNRNRQEGDVKETVKATVPLEVNVGSDKAVNEPYTYIHKDTVFEGSLSAMGRVRVAGTIKGNINVEGVVEVTEGGLVEGDLLQADTVIIIGQVRANVQASQKMEIWKKGTLQGDVRASAIDIEEGATFIGRSDMRPAAELSGSIKASKTAATALDVNASSQTAGRKQGVANIQAPKSVVA